jgi:hypothetical protein
MDQGLPVNIRIDTALSIADALQRLRVIVGRRAAIDGRRHGLTERFVTGAIDEATVKLDVKRRYIGPLHDRNSWSIRFAGNLQENHGRTALEGEIDYRFPFAGGVLRLTRLFVVALAGLGLLIAVEGIASARPDAIVGLLLLVPGALLFLGVPHLDGFVERRAKEDAAVLIQFLETTLSGKADRRE